jgi:hypothetical protein
MVPGLRAKSTALLFNFSSTINLNQKKHDALSLKIQASIRHTIAGTFAECPSPQKVDAMVCNVRMLSYLLRSYEA